MARNLWDEVNAVDYNVPSYMFDEKIRDGLGDILENINQKHEEYNKIKVLKDVFSLGLNLHNRNAPPYQKRFAGSIDIDDFNKEMQGTLHTIIQEGVLSSDYILCRVLDVYCILSRDFKLQNTMLFPKLIDLIDEVFSKGLYSLTTDLLKRGFQLFGKKGKEDEKTKKLIEKVDRTLEIYDFTTPLEETIVKFLYDLLELTYELRYIKEKKYPEMMSSMAKVLEENKEFDIAVEWWELCAKWYNKIRFEKLADECLKNKALIYYESVKNERNKVNIDNRVAARHMSLAILTLRKVKGNEALLNQWNKELGEYQKNSVSQMKPLKLLEIDLSLQFQKIDKDLVGKSPIQIIEYIGNMVHSFDYETKSKEVSLGIPQMWNLIHKDLINNEGKTIDTSDKDEEDEFPITLRLKYLEHYIEISNCIQRCLEILHEQYFVRIQDILELTRDNNFIPEGRERMYAKGLYEGVKGQYMESLSILIPQFENSIRFILEQNGKGVTSFGEDGVQEEKNLNQLLRFNELEDIFERNKIKDMKILFIHKGGFNLRNKISHGLMSESDFQTPEVVYAFGLILHIILSFKFKYIS
ncbi:DUF4209 domain-containing protein [Bacillus cereus]|uniref:DUF4209 domain-containing protein n=1 Tax=Bacillus cereus TaxID=1396 RepID=UPI00387A0E99